MIHELRMQHFRLFVLLALLLPAAILAGLAARSPTPTPVDEVAPPGAP